MIRARYGAVYCFQRSLKHFWLLKNCTGLRPACLSTIKVAPCPRSFHVRARCGLSLVTSHRSVVQVRLKRNSNIKSFKIQTWKINISFILRRERSPDYQVIRRALLKNQAHLLISVCFHAHLIRKLKISFGNLHKLHNWNLKHFWNNAKNKHFPLWNLVEKLK